jgi:hypothetical protein
MINKIKNKYYEYNPSEFLPIYRDGKIDNMRDFHLLKAKKAALAMDRAFQRVLDAAYSK